MPNDTAPAPILVNRVTLRYRRGDVGSVALDDVTLAIQPAELLCITGPSGSGKSSLLNILAGLQRPTDGSVLYNGTAISDMPEDLLLRWRRDHVGFVFQFHNLFPALTTEDNIAVPLVLFPLDREARQARVEAAIALVGMSTHRRKRPHELSGGQQQLTAIARALVTNAPLLLADEPTGHLDRASADHVMQVLATINREFGRTVVVVTHDPRVAAFARRTVRLDKGRLCGEPTP
jgi:putative ABC transport system ATP-binding protein